MGGLSQAEAAAAQPCGRRPAAAGGRDRRSPHLDDRGNSEIHSTTPARDEGVPGADAVLAHRSADLGRREARQAAYPQAGACLRTIAKNPCWPMAGLYSA